MKLTTLSILGLLFGIARSECPDLKSMKFKGEYPSVDLLCRRTIQRCKDNAAESKERKLEAKRATDATLERVIDDLSDWLESLFPAVAAKAGTASD